MKYLLDTSICIQHLRRRSAEITQRIATVGADAALSSVVLHELAFGAARSRDPVKEGELVERFRRGYVSLPVDDRIAMEAARIRADLASAGTPIGPYDLLIAATARAHGLIVVTCNTGEFARVSGLRVENWTNG